MDYNKSGSHNDTSAQIIELSAKEALDALMSQDLYCTTELPEYFNLFDYDTV